MDAQVALPVLALYGRRILSNPAGTGNKPLLGLFADLFNRRALERLFRVCIALVREMPCQSAMSAGLFWKSIKRQVFTSIPFTTIVTLAPVIQLQQ